MLSWVGGGEHTGLSCRVFSKRLQCSGLAIRDILNRGTSLIKVCS